MHTTRTPAGRPVPEPTARTRPAELLRTQFRLLVETAGTAIICMDADSRITVFNPAAERAFGRDAGDVIGQPYPDLLPEPVRAKVRADLRRVLAGIPIAQFENVVRRADGGHAVLLWNMTRLPVSRGDAAGIVAVGQDITSMQRMQERLIRQTRHLEGLTRIDRAILALQPAAVIAQAAIDHLALLVQCESAAVVAFDAASGEAVRIAARGSADVLPPLARALRDADFLEPVWPESWDAPFVVPLVANQGRLGALVLTFADGVDALTLVELASIGQVADRLAIALDNTRLFEAEREARRQFQDASARLVEIQETERRRIARELHDDIGQGLTGLLLDLEMQSRARGDRDTGLQRALAMVHSLIARVRDLSLDLRPSALDDLGLVPALIALAERYSAQTGIDVAFDHRGAGGRFPPEVETAAFRIVQEALTNVARHAGVRRAAVSLEANATCLQVVVQDRGRGFDAPPPAAAPSTGLSSMRERAEMLDGRLHVESTPGRGTTVHAVLPLSRRARRRSASAARRTPAR